MPQALVISGYRPNSSAVISMAVHSKAHSRIRFAIRGNIKRTAAAAIAKAPRIVPITDAGIPRSKPSTGTTKVCTSQQDDKSQLTSMSRRKSGLDIKSQALGTGLPGAAMMGGNSCTRLSSHQLSRGKSASTKKAAR